MTKVLIYQIGSIGDTIVTIPAILSVKRHFGKDARYYLVHKSSELNIANPGDVLKGTGIIDNFFEYDISQKWYELIYSIVKLWFRLFTVRFDHAIYLAPSDRPRSSAWRDKSFFKSCRIKKLWGFYPLSKKILYSRKPNGQIGRVRHESLCRLDRLKKDGIDVSLEENMDKPYLVLPEGQYLQGSRWLSEHRKHPGSQLIAVCPCTKQAANIWPLDRFREVGRRLMHAKRYEIIVVGGTAEKDDAETLIRDEAAHLNAAGLFSPLGSAVLLKHCRFMIGLDTGTMHLAAICGVPCVALFSAHGYPGRWDPLGKCHVVIRTHVPCEGCQLMVCPVPDHPCMSQITVDQVWSAIQQMERNLDLL